MWQADVSTFVYQLQCNTKFLVKHCNTQIFAEELFKAKYMKYIMLNYMPLIYDFSQNFPEYMKYIKDWGQGRLAIFLKLALSRSSANGVLVLKHIKNLSSGSCIKRNLVLRKNCLSGSKDIFFYESSSITCFSPQILKQVQCLLHVI